MVLDSVQRQANRFEAALPGGGGRRLEQLRVLGIEETAGAASATHGGSSALWLSAARVADHRMSAATGK